MATPALPDASHPGEHQLGRRAGDAGWHIRAAADTSEYREALPVLAGHVVADGEELRYAYRPTAGPDQARYDATSFALDLVFTDGSRLSELAGDQYGIALDPGAQSAAKMLWVDQWNLRRVSLDAALGRTVESAQARVGARSVSVDAHLDLVEIGAAPSETDDVLDLVHTTRGAWSSDRFSRGNTVPLVASPHGQVFGLPMTDAASREWSYVYDRRDIQAFATSHIPSPWIGDRGVFEVMPSPLAEPDCGRVARALAFDHDREIDRPDLYSVQLAGGITASMTAAESVVAMRFEFTGPQGSIVFDHLGTARDVELWPDESDRGEQHFRITCRIEDPNEPLAHFVAIEVRGSVEGFRSHSDEDHFLGAATIDVATTPVVDVIVGISTIGADEAIAHRDECGGFDVVADRSARAWREQLDVLQVDGVSAVQRTDLTSDLYRLFLYPNHHDEDGRYRSPETDVVRAGRYSANNGFWDTYRTCWPALGLLTPATASELANGFVEHYLDGGWTARWSAPGPIQGMTGTSSDTVFTDLAVRAVPGLAVEDAYSSAVKNATVPSPASKTGRKGLRHGIFRGYIDTDTSEGMSWTLDNAINDASIARLARILGASASGAQRERYQTEERYFARRGLGYQAVFHRGLKYFLGRRPDGGWRLSEQEFDPRVWGYDYTETNAWGTRFTAPHDGAGLAELYGGEAELGQALEAFFAEPETASEEFCGSYGFVIHEMAEAREIRMGMFGLSNQPAHHIPFMYMFAGRHDDAHRIVVESRGRCFAGSDFGQGFPGDEDNGEMSGWHLFTSLGLYPLVPGSGEYVLVPPGVGHARLRIPGGDLEITADRPGAPYIRRVLIDGVEWDQVSVPHSRLARGAKVEFELSDEPCGWASGSRPTSLSTEFGVTPLVDLAAAGLALTDDFGDTSVELAAGQSVELPLVRTARVGMYTVSGAEPGSRAWVLEGRNGAGNWVELDRREEESFDWVRQTRPFAVRAEGVAEMGAVRLTALRTMTATQIEVFEGDQS